VQLHDVGRGESGGGKLADIPHGGTVLAVEVEFDLFVLEVDFEGSPKVELGQVLSGEA
jgi:hypothetical protein